MYQFTFIRGTNKFSFVYHFFEYVSGVMFAASKRVGVYRDAKS